MGMDLNLPNQDLYEILLQHPLFIEFFQSANQARALLPRAEHFAVTPFAQLRNHLELLHCYPPPTVFINSSRQRFRKLVTLFLLWIPTVLGFSSCCVWDSELSQLLGWLLFLEANCGLRRCQICDCSPCIAIRKLPSLFIYFFRAQLLNTLEFLAGNINWSMGGGLFPLVAAEGKEVGLRAAFCNRGFSWRNPNCFEINSKQLRFLHDSLAAFSNNLIS